jgi:CDGSH-type Zn-finger protein
MAEATITPTTNGPYRVRGSFRLVDEAGTEIPFSGDEVYLCRCGGSQSKPFCDGTHRKNGFQAPSGPMRPAG